MKEHKSNKKKIKVGFSVNRYEVVLYILAIVSVAVGYIQAGVILALVVQLAMNVLYRGKLLYETKDNRKEHHLMMISISELIKEVEKAKAKEKAPAKKKTPAKKKAPVKKKD